MRRRLDQEMVRRELVESRARAKELIEGGKVRVAGAPATNAARLVDASEPIQIAGDRPRFVSRGGEKLDAALNQFNIDVAGKRALDVGASTGGFTDCLLQRGAASVVALDVGTAQLHERLRSDERVDVREKTNIRYVSKADFGDKDFDVITADVSFISLKVIAEKLMRELAAPGSDVVVLVKPQFEAGRVEVSRGKGVISDSKIWKEVLQDIVSATRALGGATMGAMVSPLLGAEGNVEFLLHLRPHSLESSNEVETLDYEGLIAAGQASVQAKRGGK